MVVLLYLTTLTLIVNVHGGWVDPDSPPHTKKIKSFSDGIMYDLVMSDEFNKAGRRFLDGHDPMWTGIDRSDDDQTSNGRKSLQFYNSSYITTRDGNLVIRTTTEDTKWRGWNPYKKKYDDMRRHFRSGMLQSWNKFCYTGGILEVRLQFPGMYDVGGLWPAVWLLGNLGRATFEGSTNLMWPWSYSKCNRNLQRAQEISGCDITNHYSLNAGQGRGATEIDIIEVMAGPDTKLPLVKKDLRRPYSSMTLQLAPGIPASMKRPFAGALPEWGFTWYDNITYGAETSINPFFYGTYLAQTKSEEPVARSKLESYQCDALSSMLQLSEDHFQSMHTFRLEWQPGENGYVHWYADNVFRFGVEADGLKIMESVIPNEPSYIIFNTAISTSWGFPNPPPGCVLYDCKDPAGQCGMNPGFCKSLPAEFKIDYVRVYQNKEDPRQTVGCNPKGYPTKRFIAAHEYRYKADAQVHPIKEIQNGGHRCNVQDDAPRTSTAPNVSEVTHCGEGYCSFGRCKCKTGWTGPSCKVPDYFNDEPDFDGERWVPLKLPYIPLFLRVAIFLFALTLGLAAIYNLYYQRSSNKGVIFSHTFYHQQGEQQTVVDSTQRTLVSHGSNRDLSSSWL